LPLVDASNTPTCETVTVGILVKEIEPLFDIVPPEAAENVILCLVTPISVPPPESLGAALYIAKYTVVGPVYAPDEPLKT
jgi:hypothetical protein